MVMHPNPSNGGLSSTTKDDSILVSHSNTKNSPSTVAAVANASYAPPGGVISIPAPSLSCTGMATGTSPSYPPTTSMSFHHHFPTTSSSSTMTTTQHNNNAVDHKNLSISFATTVPPWTTTTTTTTTSGTTATATTTTASSGSAASSARMMVMQVDSPLSSPRTTNSAPTTPNGPNGGNFPLLDMELSSPLLDKRTTISWTNGGDTNGGGGAGGTPGAGEEDNSTTSNNNSSNPENPGGHKNRRQKRLERNRESARLSRRRRKQYLDVLEERVSQLSEEMDQGRRQHVSRAVDVVRSKRAAASVSSLQQFQHPSSSPTTDLSSSSNIIKTCSFVYDDWGIPVPSTRPSPALFRASAELLVAATFRDKQLQSFCSPPSDRFVLWLTLQADDFFRGGRAASERLSAARIGERVRAYVYIFEM